MFGRGNIQTSFFWTAFKSHDIRLFLFRPLKIGSSFVFGCILVFFSFFPTQNQVPQKIIELSWFEHSKSFPSVEKIRFEIFDFSSYFERMKRASSSVLNDQLLKSYNSSLITYKLSSTWIKLVYFENLSAFLESSFSKFQKKVIKLSFEVKLRSR